MKTQSGEQQVGSLQRILSEPSLIRLYRDLSDDDIAMAEEGLAEYQRQVNASDA